MICHQQAFNELPRQPAFSNANALSDQPGSCQLASLQQKPLRRTTLFLVELSTTSGFKGYLPEIVIAHSALSHICQITCPLHMFSVLFPESRASWLAPCSAK